MSGRGVDRGRLRALLDRLAGEQADLERLAQLPTEDLLADTDRLKSVKYSFVLAIEISVDIAHHLVAALRLRSPESYAEAFLVLAESGLLPRELADQLVRMARFRNLLVHQYATVDDRQVVEILHTRVVDLEDYSRAVAAYLLDVDGGTDP